MIDHVEIYVQGGKGGDGRVSFLHLKFIPKGGPDGGDGGHGGSVYLVGNKDLNTLRHFLGTRRFRAEPGQYGGTKLCHGKDGEDVVIQVPLGTIVYGLGEIVTDGQRMIVAKGGKGGRGNDHFKSGTNTTPQQAELGELGEQRDLKLELKLLANVGLVGFPNAGKSTLLSVLTKARPEIANYPFTTLSPNLGVISDLPNGGTLVVADIPGLIEGASQGKGLGHDFLRHIERCSTLVFVLSLEEAILWDEDLSFDQKVEQYIQQFRTLYQEMITFNPNIVKDKKVLVCINKADLFSPEFEADKVRAAVVKQWPHDLLPVKSEHVLITSGASKTGVKEIKQKLAELAG